ncbi:nuclear transport factor 2 family protein [Arundinibacter roseus]|uniref:Nuclear transport factor 2 family protein n=1 Tax=Arundinibacter roseus TaxID=2070510 RepID=A0A4R4KCP4_9BACT|nr:nuclear transport factor 2 family protein [Arundinibacter roseus]TDB64049.1 nuclear transport factor 2 family protein [Arundinibacter roseus]
MTPNEKLLTTFYNAFQQKDYKTMQQCYAESATFSDEVFRNLDTVRVRAMWEMLIKRGKDLQIEFKNIEANETLGSAEWIATYTFSRSNRKVINHIHANFMFEDGKIVHHVDRFDFYKWARQALGISGLFLGWSPFLRKKVQKSAAVGLTEFLNKR